MLQKILENISAVIAVITALWAIYEKVKALGVRKALKFMVAAVDYMPLDDKAKSDLAVVQETAKVREAIVPIMKEVRKERLDSKEFSVGVDIDEKGKPQAGAKFSWRF